MKRLNLLISTLFLSLSFQINAKEIFFKGDFETNFPNPERGYSYSVDPSFENMTWSFCEQDPNKYTATAWTKALTTSELKYLRNTKAQSLVLVRYHIAEFRYTPLSKAFLERLQNDFNVVRNSKFKIIPHFTYNWVGGGPDAPSDIILSHLEQLRPLLQENYDVIAYMYMALIGCWGEQHSSAFGNLDTSKGYNRLNQKTIDIINKAFEILPKERMLTFRIPQHKFQYFNGLQKNEIIENTPIANITENEAYNQSIRSRWGNEEHCLVCGENNCGTYNTPANNPRAVIDWLENENKYVVQGGEPGITNGCGSPSTDIDGDGYAGEDKRDECNRIIGWMSKHKWSTINENFNWNIDNWAVQKWRDEGCYYEIARNLGYRFRLLKGNIPEEINSNETFDINLTITNDGYAACYNARGVELIFRNKLTGEKYPFAADLTQKSNDPRFWLGGKTHILSFNSFVIPEDMPSGDYDLLLNLYDPHPKLRNIPEYAIHLANIDTWEAVTGYNDLQVSVKVNNPNVSTIKILENKSKLIIIPNPIVDTFHVESDKYSIKRIDIIDLSGKIAYTSTGGSGDLSSLINGIYSMRIITDKGIAFRKIIKK